jgi:adenine/guanine phosphoribosyltransferase-like PRPP-binding protein
MVSSNKNSMEDQNIAEFSGSESKKVKKEESRKQDDSTSTGNTNQLNNTLGRTIEYMKNQKISISFGTEISSRNEE